LQRSSGDLFTVKSNVIPIENDGQIKYYVSIWVDVTEEKELEQNMKYYTAEVIRAHEEEKNKIARDIHDGTVQELTMMLMECEEIRKNNQYYKEIIQPINQLCTKIKCVTEELRQISHELRPGLIDYYGLIPSIELLVEEMNDRNGIVCNLDIITSERRLPNEIEISLYRITQEALSNAIKHSKAKRASVQITF